MLLDVCSVDVNEALQELKVHGTPDFECAAYELRFKSGAGTVIPWHWHGELEAAYVAEGEITVRLPGSALRVRAGESFFINANVLHCYEAEEGGKVRSAVFGSELVTGGANTVFERRYLRPLMENRAFTGLLLHAGEFRQIHELMPRFFSVMASEPVGFEFTAREILSQLCLMLCERYADTTPRPMRRSPDADRVRDMLALIHERWAEPLELGDIARSANVGERECERAFKRLIGLTPKQYLIKYRTARAASLLSSRPDLSIAEVAARCGFNSPSVFARTFRDYYSVTPREYRRSI